MMVQLQGVSHIHLEGVYVPRECIHSIKLFGTSSVDDRPFVEIGIKKFRTNKACITLKDIEKINYVAIGGRKSEAIKAYEVIRSKKISSLEIYYLHKAPQFIVLPMKHNLDYVNQYMSADIAKNDMLVLTFEKVTR